MASINPTTTTETPVHVKIAVNGKDENRKFKLTLRDLGATVLPEKLCNLLQISSTQEAVFERYSDSSASYITLEASNPSVYKQLYRAAKAKGKLRLRVTITNKASSKPEVSQNAPTVPDRLTSRCYVHPYISDSSNNDSSPSARLSTLVDLKTASEAPSTATLVPATKTKAEPQATANMTQSKPYHWPITDNAEWSEATKSTFDKQDTKDALRVVQDAIAARNAKNAAAARKPTTEEAPVPRFFSAREHCRAELAGLQQHTPALRSFTLGPKLCANFTICCNSCDGAIPNAHWHCSICDDGDFDLCQDCVEQKCHCDNEDHWMIKRYVEDGKVITSKTETIAPKTAVKADEEKEIPGAFNSAIKAEIIPEAMDLSRTCNQCVQVFDESKFVTCKVCDDYDLCVPCHVAMKHGHHPNHGFAPASSETSLTKMAMAFLAPGRNTRHWAICDGCDNDIYGVRHKCLSCPDWDYCSTCRKEAHINHPGHTFASLYEPILNSKRLTQKHVGVYCDGPMCEGKGYIVGDRYKCAVCHDTDFCANCEALPLAIHNRTHPLIKFKTPVNNVSISTFGSKQDGSPMMTMGDKISQTSSKATETNAPAPSTNAATQVQTVAEVKPVEASIKSDPKEAAAPKLADLEAELNAHFVSDIIADGSTMATGAQFTQAWTLRNPGPHPWPSGCSVCFIGGDGMLDVDPNHPSHITQIRKAIKTNTIEHEVKAGEEVSYEVVMRASEREGKAISYWRLKTAEGMPFGHKLWCDINVKKPVHEQATTKHIEDIAMHQPKVEDEADATAKEVEPKTSQMIFPKLDKESPVSSLHEGSLAVAPAAGPVTPLDKDFEEDVESLALDDEESSDEGFLTDEEYELVASDNEMEEAKNGKK